MTTMYVTMVSTHSPVRCTSAMMMSQRKSFAFR